MLSGRVGNGLSFMGLRTRRNRKKIEYYRDLSNFDTFHNEIIFKVEANCGRSTKGEKAGFDCF